MRENTKELLIAVVILAFVILFYAVLIRSSTKPGVLYMNGDGTIVEHVGSYTDLLEKLKAQTKPAAKPADKPKALREKPRQPARMSFKDKRLLEILPAEVEALEKQIAALEAKLADPNFYMENPAAFGQTTAELEKSKAEKDEKESLWLELAERA